MTLTSGLVYIFGYEIPMTEVISIAAHVVNWDFGKKWMPGTSFLVKTSLRDLKIRMFSGSAEDVTGFITEAPLNMPNSSVKDLVKVFWMN
jgi:hypothetical protein